MLNKKITLTEDDLKKIIGRVIREYAEELSKIQSNIIIRTYSMTDESDRQFISDNIDTIFDILQNAYKSKGGLVGLNKKEDIINRKTYVRLAFYNNQIVAVATYNNISGGNKMDYCGAIGGELHDIGRAGFFSIVTRDKENITEYNWIEASGAVEEAFRKFKAYNLPSKYAQQLFPNKKIEQTDDFHYLRTIGKFGQKFKKTIFGFRDESLLNAVYNDVFGDTLDSVEQMYQKLLDSQNSISEASEKSMQAMLNLACDITSLFMDAYYDNEIREFPRRFLLLMDSTAKILYKFFQGNNRGMSAYNTLIDILNGSTVLEPLRGKIKFEEKDLI